MESHAPPGTIQVTERAHERLRQRYELRPRGEIEVKGKGSMTPYLLIGRRPAGATTGRIDGPESTPVEGHHGTR
jgi:adenylate cyclase